MPRRRAQYGPPPADAHQDARALLRDALRLPAQNRVVAEWIFDEQELDFHVHSNTVPPDAFDKAQVLVSKSEFIPGNDTPLPCSSFQQITNCSNNDPVTLFMLHLLVKEHHGFYMGYTFTIGSPFEESLLPLRDAFKTYSIIGRFVLDIKRRHLLVYIANFSANTSLIMALNWPDTNHRQRVYFSVPNEEYSFHKMPSTVSGITINDEYLVPGHGAANPAPPSPAPPDAQPPPPSRPVHAHPPRPMNPQQHQAYAPDPAIPHATPPSPQISPSPAPSQTPTSSSSPAPPPPPPLQLTPQTPSSPPLQHMPSPLSGACIPRSREGSTVTKASAYRSLLPTESPWVEDVTVLHPDLLDTFDAHTPSALELPAASPDALAAFDDPWGPPDTTSADSFSRHHAAAVAAPALRPRPVPVLSGFGATVNATAINYFAEFLKGISSIFQGTYFSPGIIQQISSGLGESASPSIAGQIRVQIDTAPPDDMKVLQTFARRKYYAETQPVSPDEYFISSDQAESVAGRQAGQCSSE